jgi:hypothetical protein
LCRLARIGRRVARDQNRIAELYELLVECRRVTEFGEQMALPFGEGG